jgi:hypothetical protein
MKIRLTTEQETRLSTIPVAEEKALETGPSTETNEKSGSKERNFMRIRTEWQDRGLATQTGASTEPKQRTRNGEANQANEKNI